MKEKQMACGRTGSSNGVVLCGMRKFFCRYSVNRRGTESAGKNDGESSSDTLVVDVFTGVGNFQGTQGDGSES